MSQWCQFWNGLAIFKNLLMVARSKKLVSSLACLDIASANQGPAVRSQGIGTIRVERDAIERCITSRRITTHFR